ncbi:RING/U-box superfamily protein [Striga hermonthica]|uniref:RING/U-box superfamily protein n=1 Tax=Striga hermonthica TaxID=68872 RepID=A0A9N7NE72_STRHE|nr:RING/U-box superfamily protein [Striga hermonthica]
MSTRYFFSPDSLCDSGSTVSNFTVDTTSPHARPSRNSPPMLIRLAMKISRSRWYSFLRRVFHYQNGSGSDLGPNPFDSKKWMAMELSALVVQISLTFYTLIVSKDERPVWPMRLWVVGYAFACFFSIGLLCLRYRLVYVAQPDGYGFDVEQQGYHQDSSSYYHSKFKTWVELILAIWFVMGNVWVFDSRLSSYKGAPRLHALCISILAWNAITYSFPFILFVMLCCCVPLLGALLGYNMNAASLSRGATHDQLAALPSWQYNGVFDLDNQEVPECCICLAKYSEKEEIRQLPCNHIFHLNCVDHWLRIISCCPLCKQGIE